jgi:hypothetical protein
MANEINIGINTTSNLDGINQVEQSVKSLKTQLKEAQANVAALSDTFGATSKEAIEAAKAAAILKDRMGDAKALTDAFNPDAKFKAVSSSLVGVAGGFSAVTGAMGIFGEKSKDVEQAVLKVQSAMALASGVQAIGESIDSFKQLGAVIKSTTIFQRIATAAQWLWNAALNANPIGAVVVAVTALIGVGYLMIKMFKSTNETLEVSKENIEKYNKKIEAQTTLLETNRRKKHELQEFELRLMKAQGKSEEAILKRALAISKENQQEAYKQYELKRTTLEMHKNIIATYESTQADLDKKIALEEYGSVLKVHYEEQKKNNARELVNSKEQLNASILANNAAVKVVNEANAQFKKSKEDLIIFTTQKETTANQEAIDRQIEQNKKQQEIRDEAARKRLEKQQQGNTKEKKEEVRSDKQKIEDLEKYLKDEKDAFDKRTEDEYQTSIDLMNLQDVGFEDDLNKKLEHYKHLKTIQEDYGKETINIDTQIAETKIEIDKKAADDKKAIAEAELVMRRVVADKTIQVAGQAGQLLQDIAGKSKGVAIGGVIVEKAASIAGIISNTAEANAQFLANPVSAATLGTAAISPIALNNISAGISIASILAQSAKSISEINGAKSSDMAGGGATQKPSKFATGGLVSGLGTSTSDSIMANLSNGESVINAKSTAMFGNLLSNINQAGGGVGFGTQNNANPIFKTYVVASEMTSQIEANLKLKQIARL